MTTFKDFPSNEPRGWISDVARIYVSVLSRKRNGFTILSYDWTVNSITWKMVHAVTNDHITINFVDSERYVNVVVYVNDQLPSWDHDNFFRSMHCKTNPEPVKKEALILARKLRNKPMFDILEER
jgi:hypothetical protein